MLLHELIDKLQGLIDKGTSPIAEVIIYDSGDPSVGIHEYMAGLADVYLMIDKDGDVADWWDNKDGDELDNPPLAYVVIEPKV